MIRSFRDRGTRDVFDGKDSKAARRTCPPELWPVARRKLDQLNAAVSRESLRLPPGNRWEKLEDPEGRDAIRINGQYRICYIWDGGRTDTSRDHGLPLRCDNQGSRIPAQSRNAWSAPGGSRVPVRALDDPQ